MDNSTNERYEIKKDGITLTDRLEVVHIEQIGELNIIRISVFELHVHKTLQQTYVSNKINNNINLDNHEYKYMENHDEIQKGIREENLRTCLRTNGQRSQRNVDLQPTPEKKRFQSKCGSLSQLEEFDTEY